MEIDDDKYTIVFPKEYESIAQQTANMLEAYIPIYDQYYNYKLDDKILFFIDKPTQQQSNGSSLFNKIHIYTGAYSVLYYDLATMNQWINLLVTHELAHSYQLISTKFPFKRSIFKYDISLLLEPNVFIPLSLIEGNAVLMESLFGNGGRLYSGYSKALLNSMIADNRLTKNLLLFNTTIFPYSDTRYLIGGFFFKYLYDRYGLDVVNAYYIKHSSYYLTPFSLAFESHFGDNFENIFNDFIKEYKKKKFIKSKGELIAQSAFAIDLNKQNDEVYFFTSKPYGDNTLNTFNTFSQEIKTKKSTFYNTRAFKINGKFYFLSNQNIDDEVLYGLYDEEFNLLQNSSSKMVTYVNGKDMYYFDASNSFEKLHLYKNEKFIDKIDSSNVLIDNDDLYYFKNINEKRWLIKNKEKVFSFMGRYAFVVDKDAEFIYFIASSDNGSSLFAWDKSKKEVFRVFQGDDIYNAKKINKDYFLLSVVRSDTHQLIKAKSSYFKDTVNEDDLHLSNFKIQVSNKKFKMKTYNPWKSITLKAISLPLYAGKYVSLFASDISNKIEIDGHLAPYFDAYLYTLNYRNNYNEAFKHQIIGTISGQFEVLLLKLLYKNNLWVKGNMKTSLELGYEYLDKRKDKHSLSLFLEKHKLFQDVFDSFLSSGYNTSLYINKIISDGINIKAKGNLYKKLSQNWFLKGGIQSAFSSSKAYKNKISIKESKIASEHIEAEYYPDNRTFNDWVVKTSLRLDYEKPVNLDYLFLTKSNMFISISNFKSENNQFNEYVLGVKPSFFVGYNNEVDFIAKTIYNDIYGNKYKFEIEMGL